MLSTQSYEAPILLRRKHERKAVVVVETAIDGSILSQKSGVGRTPKYALMCGYRV